jgi:hypothetical protein
MSKPMPSSRSRWAAAALLGALLLPALLAFAVSGQEGAAEAVSRAPRVDPDIDGVTIPPNVAPLNVRLLEGGERYRIVVGAGRDGAIELTGEMPDVRIPAGAWRDLLQESRGAELTVAVEVRSAAGAWQRFEPLHLHVADEEIDSHLVYRLLRPVYNKYMHMGIYQRDLTTFDESPIIDNRHADNACLNCHTFHGNRPDPLLLETRGKGPSPVLLARGGKVETIDTRTDFHYSPATYATWHPDGRHVAFSLNNATLFFHTDPALETREVFDATSELVVYDVDENVVSTAPEISSVERAETWPEWSADGRHLYFSATDVTPIEDYAGVRYDLMRIAYDAASQSWGEVEQVLAADEVGGSVLQSKVSPDGRWLVCTISDHGNFPVFLRTSDLYVVDLRALGPQGQGEARRLPINSDDEADSWHAWSSNSHWLAFSSKRRDGLFSRTYFSYVGENGTFHKPFLLPQEDPGFYDRFTQTYNVPVLIDGPVEVSQRALVRALLQPEQVTQVQLDPRVAVDERNREYSSENRFE